MSTPDTSATVEVTTEKTPGIDLNDRVEVIEYVASLPYEERIALMLREESLGPLLSNDSKTFSVSLQGGATIFDVFGSGSGSAAATDDNEVECAVTQSDEIVDATNEIEAAKERISQSIIENANAHSEFLKTKESSEALQAERERLNDQISQKTKEMKDLVMAELLSNQKLKEAQDDLANATLRRNAEEKRLEEERANCLIQKAEEERIARVREAAAARKRAEDERLEAARQAELERQAALAEAERIRQEAVDEANRRTQAAIDEAQRTADEAAAEANAIVQSAIETEAAKKSEAARNLENFQNKTLENDEDLSNEGVVDTVQAPEESAQCAVENSEVLAEKDEQIKLLTNEVRNLNQATQDWYERYNELLEETGQEPYVVENAHFDSEGNIVQGGSVRTGTNANANASGGKKRSSRVDQAFRGKMNELILKRSTALKEQIEALYKERLDDLQSLVASLSNNVSEDEKVRMQLLIDQYREESQREMGWFPQVKLYAGYMKQSFEDFVVNSDIDKIAGGENNALRQLETCLERIQTFAERKAKQVVKNCAEAYRAKIELYKKMSE